MNQKKWMVDVIVITLAFLLFIIWHQNNIVSTVKTTVFLEDRDIDIRFITLDKERQELESINQGAADMAYLMGVKYSWDAPDNKSIEQQIELINNAVEQGAKALILVAEEGGLLSSAIREAKAKGVKIINVYATVNEDAIATLSTDNYKAGIRAGQTMLRILEDSGKVSGSVGIINVADAMVEKLREEGFRDTLELDRRFQVQETVYVDRNDREEAEYAAKGLMEEQKEVVGLFGASEGASIGIGNANKESGNRYVSIGFDNTEATKKLLRDQSLNAIITQNPYTMGYLGMAEAVAAVNSRDTGPKYIDTGVSVMTNY